MIVALALKKVYHHSLPFNKRWPPWRNRRLRSVTAYGPSYRSASFEHRTLRAVERGQISAPAKFTSASLAPLDASSWTFGPARPTQKSWTLDHRCFARAVIKRCTHLVGRFYAFYERTRICWNDVRRWSSDPLRWWTLVYRWNGGVFAGPTIASARFPLATVTPTL